LGMFIAWLGNAEHRNSKKHLLEAKPPWQTLP
jgi:hypothetical protein